MNDAEQVVGETYARSRPAVSKAFVWSASAGVQDLPLLPDYYYSHSTDINGAGQVVGRVEASIKYSAFLWSEDAGMQDLGTLHNHQNSQAADINEPGQVVGTSGARAFLWSEGSRMQDLNGLLPAGSGWELRSAAAINDNGQILCGGTRIGQDLRWCVLNPS